MIVFQVSLNVDPVKEILKIQSQIYILIKKVLLFIKKGTLTQVFSCEFCEISKNIFFTEHLWTTASKTKHIHASAAD